MNFVSKPARANLPTQVRASFADGYDGFEQLYWSSFYQAPDCENDAAGVTIWLRVIRKIADQSMAFRFANNFLDVSASQYARIGAFFSCERARSAGHFLHFE